MSSGMPKPKDPIWIDYTNWRGERRWRKIRPFGLAFRTSTYHRDADGQMIKQWFMEAGDDEKGGRRYFALKDIHAFSITDPNA